MARQKGPNPRKMSDEARESKRAYDIKYNKENVVRVNIPFNKMVPDEAKMIEWLDGKGDGKKAPYVKGLIYDDMTKSGG